VPILKSVHPPIEPFASGLLPVGGGVEIYWEASGNPAGRPALYLHGGPGSGLRGGDYRRRYNPERHLIVGLDQRACGRSRPRVTDALGNLGANTTEALIADIEAVRGHLGIGRWLVSGVSWGTTLALAYALEHPERVTEMVLAAVTTTSREEVDWLTESMGRVFPEAWEMFESRSRRRPGERIVEAYARRLAGDDRLDRVAAADDWDSWESTHSLLDPSNEPGPLHPDETERAVFATLVTHYWANDGFLPGVRAILNRAAELAGIPVVLIHGRHDVSSPLITAWRLHHTLPDSRLVIVEQEGHGGLQMMERMTEAIDGFGL
jgi:proline iminopeptidase